LYGDCGAVADASVHHERDRSCIGSRAFSEGNVEDGDINRGCAISSRAFFECEIEGGDFDRGSIVSKIEARCFDRD
jgi:hypothetical protein